MVKDTDMEVEEHDEEPELVEGFFLVPEKYLSMILRCQKPVKEKVMVYAHRSLFMFDHRTMFR